MVESSTGTTKHAAKLAEWAASIHERRRVGEELERGHHALEDLARRGDLVGLVAVGHLDRADVVGDPAEQLRGGLDHDAVLAGEVAGAENRECIVGERRRHVRTVRLAARARNRPRVGLAWFVLLVLSGLIALCTRAAAEPATDDESGDRETSLDLLELDPLAALDTSRLLSPAELAALGPTIGAGERDDLDGGEPGREIAALPPPPRWGRIDLGVAWRRKVDLASPVVDDQIWLVVTWRR